MNILITGGSGFIGTRLVDVLVGENHTVTIFDKVTSAKYPQLVTIGDVRDKDALISATKNIDVIYNLAAEHADDVTPLSLYGDVNIGGAHNIVSAAEVNNIRQIIFTSSVAIYGLNRGTPDESMEAQPFNEYGRTKYEAEKIFLKWHTADSSRILTMVRPSVIFGENNRGNVYNLMKQIASGKFLMIGDGSNKKSMGYVGNIAAFLASQIVASSGIHIFNFSDKPDLSAHEITRIIKNELNIEKNFISVPYTLGLLGGYAFDLLSIITGKKFPVSSIRIKKFTAETTINTDKLLVSGFKAPYTLEEGLRKMATQEFKNN
jgi:GlcNAc-P-P-Und epimerase